MKLFHPKSIFQLILISFALVVLPLIAALLYAASSVDRLAAQSQQVITHAVKASETGQKLLEQMTVMERNLRQYQVLADAVLLQVYEANRDNFIKSLASLAELPLPESLRQRVNQLAWDESDFYARVQTLKNDLRSLDVSAAFSVLNKQAQQILLQSQQLIDTEVANTQAEAEQTQHNLFWLIAALVPAMLLLVAFLIVVINRPLRRLDDGIRRLGAGDFSVVLKLEGPRDLEQLGERLDWMRGRLMEVEADKKRFLQHISHELKTPLTTLREGSELLAEEIPGALTSQQREVVELLQQNSLQLQKLIEDLLTYNTATRDAMLNLQSLRFDELISDVVDEYKLSVMARRLWFEVELAEVSVMADMAKLRVIVDNLLSNAVKFSPNKGRIKI
ncbi:MAG TPA: HAMP domain-containing protein, partial [Candidatus Tenderia electrophaga]|nr:HAMP domain-containing protein [Candidatus Tenderia electrophaga]